MAIFLKEWATLCLLLQLGFLAAVSKARTESFSGETHLNLKTGSSVSNGYASIFDWVVQYEKLTSRSLNPLKRLGDKIKDFILKKVLNSWHTRITQTRCYTGVGCFYSHERMSLDIGGPQSPEEVNMTFYFFKNGSFSDMQELLNETKTTLLPNKTYTLENWTSQYLEDCIDVNKPLIVVTHGLTGSKRTPWMLPLVDALLENVNCTVLVADWEKGASGSYPDAGINTPMAGALISMFLQKILGAAKYKIGPKNITLIGFSMGAQVMGFAGRHFKNTAKETLWRIAALDPAGWLYEKTNACLSKDDAEFVDVIHTNGGSIKDFRIGLSHSAGHVDFYPNGGSVQTGCKNKPNIVYTDYMDVITCSHYKATAYFIESLRNHSCSFISYGCRNWEDFVNGNCTERIPMSQTGIMGYYSYTANGTGNQFLYTNSDPPYCRGNNTKPPNSAINLSWWKRIFARGK